MHSTIHLVPRAAEVARFGIEGLNLGAKSDIDTATLLLWEAVAEYGLCSVVGPVSLPALLKRQFGVGTHLAAVAEKQVCEKLQAAQQVSDQFVRQYWTQIKVVADRLIINEELDEDAVRWAMVSSSTKTGILNRGIGRRWAEWFRVHKPSGNVAV